MEPELTTAAIHWLSPEGVGALTALLGTVFSIVIAILNMMGKKKLAVEVERKAKELKELHGVATGIIEGVETFRREGSLNDAKKLAEAIKDVTVESGVEEAVNRLVKTVTRGSTIEAMMPPGTSGKS